MEPILNLSPQEFRAALAELQLDPQREADLMRQYRRVNSPFAPIYGLLDRAAQQDTEQGTERASMLPVSRPEGMSVADAVRSGQAQFAMPQGLLDAIGGTFLGIDAPAAAYQGVIPSEDMAGEGFGAAAVSMGLGGLLTRPAGSVGMGGGVAPDARASDWLDDLRSLYPDTQIDVSGGPGRGYTVSRIVVPEDARSQGLGTQIMREITDIADSQGATVALTPSSDFGGNVSRLREFYGRMGFVANTGRNRDMSISEDMYREPISANRSTTTGLLASAASDTPAQQVARLLREGRADEVTDDLMAQADPQEMFRLYEAGETGMDLPMDEASRMARAREMGFANEAYHGASSDFQFIDPEMATEKSYGGGIWFADNPDIAQTYAGNIYDSGQSYPVLINTQNFASSDWRGRPWGDAREETRISFPEQYNRPSQRISDIYEDWASWASTDNAARAANQGELSGLRVRNVVDVGPYIFNRPDSQKKLPETGESIAVFDPTAVRSRFARFDPRLSNLRNLNAANVDPLTGAAAVSASQQDDPLANLRAYIAAAGGVLPR